MRKSQYFPFQCWVLNKGSTGTIFITSLVWRGPWLGIEPGTSRTRSQHYTTRLSRRRFQIRQCYLVVTAYGMDKETNNQTILTISCLGAIVANLVAEAMPVFLAACEISLCNLSNCAWNIIIKLAHIVFYKLFSSKTVQLGVKIDYIVLARNQSILVCSPPRPPEINPFKNHRIVKKYT